MFGRWFGFRCTLGASVRLRIRLMLCTSLLVPLVPFWWQLHQPSWSVRSLIDESWFTSTAAGLKITFADLLPHGSCLAAVTWWLYRRPSWQMCFKNIIFTLQLCRTWSTLRGLNTDLTSRCGPGCYVRAISNLTMASKLSF